MQIEGLGDDGGRPGDGGRLGDDGGIIGDGWAGGAGGGLGMVKASNRACWSMSTLIVRLPAMMNDTPIDVAPASTTNLDTFDIPHCFQSKESHIIRLCSQPGSVESCGLQPFYK